MTPQDTALLPYRPNVGVMLANRDGRVFVGERLDSPGAWQMPQGGIDKGETPRAAALRELEEETGVAPGLVTIEAELDDWLTYDLPAELIGRLWKGRYRGQKQRWFLMRFQGEDGDVNIQTAHPEFGRWQWLEPGQVLEHIVVFKRPVYEAVLAGFAPHLQRAG